MADDSNPQQQATAFKGFKKRKQSFVRRQRKSESSESDDGEDSAVKKVERAGNKLKILGNSSGPNVISKKGSRSLRRSKSDEESEDENGFESKRSKLSINYESSRTGKREGPDDMGATSTLEIETQFDRDAQAIYEKQLQTNKEKKGQIDDKLYKGQSGYAKYYEKRDTAQGNAASGMVR